MEAAGGKIAKRGKRRWLRRALGVGGVMVGAAVITPFIFTGPLVRYWLGHSGYRDLPLRFGKARLSPLGRLALYDVQLDDVGEQAGKKLVTAGRVELSFRWADISSGRLQRVVLDQADVTLRPGKDVATTLMTIFSGPAGAATVGSAAPAGSGGSAWVEQIVVNGVMRVEGYGGVMTVLPLKDGEAVPVDLAVTLSGVAGNWNGTMAVVAGQAVGKMPRVSGKVSMARTGEMTSVKLESVTVENFEGKLSERGLAAVGAVPEWALRPLTWQVESLGFSGSGSLSRGNVVSCTVELRDFNARTNVGDVPVSVAHFAAGAHVEGKVSAAPMDDLNFSRMACAWEGVEVGDWKAGSGKAEWAVEGSELELTNLKTTLGDADVQADGAFDVATRTISHGTCLVKGFSPGNLLARLPAGYLPEMPFELGGDLSLYVRLTESDVYHLAAIVDLLCPDRLEALPLRAQGVRAATTSEVPKPLGWLSNLQISGKVSRTFAPEKRLELSDGRMTADQLMIFPRVAQGDGEAGLAVNKIKSDFDATSQKVALHDFYADLPGNGRFTATGDYRFGDKTLEQSMITLSGIDAALLNNWLPEGWAASGQMKTTAQGAFTERGAELLLTMDVSSPATLKGAGGTLSVSGTQAPGFSGHLKWDRLKGTWSVETSIDSLSSLQADAAMVDAVRKVMAPAPGSGWDVLLQNIKTGCGLSFDKVGLSGEVDKTQMFSGQVIINGLDIAVGPDRVPQLLNLTFTSDTSMPVSWPVDVRTVRMKAEEILAEKIVLGQNVATELKASLSAGDGRALLTGAFKFAEGRVDGDASLSLPGQLDAMHLNLASISQEVVTRSLFPSVFTAEGPISGKVTLLGKAGGALAGSMELTADKAGRLKISREASSKTFAPVAAAAANSQGATLPKNFDEIVVDQLADYPYVTGRATLQDSSEGLKVVLDYTRAPLEPGESGYGVPVTVGGQEVKANLGFQLRGASVTVNNSIESLLKKFLDMRDSAAGVSGP